MIADVAPSASHLPSAPAESDPLPDGWVWARLADVTERVPNTDPTEQPDRVFGYVDISSVSNTHYRIDEPKRIRGADAPSRARRPIRPGDVLFSNVRTYLRNVAIVPDGLDAQVCSTGFTVLRPNRAVDPQLLFRYVLTDQFIDRVTPEQTGTHYPATSDRVVLDQPIPLPPLTEQQRIVEAVEALLAQVNAARERLARVPAILRRFRQAVLAAAYSGRLTEHLHQGHSSSSPDGQQTNTGLVMGLPELPELPHNWDLVTVGGAAGQIQYGTSVKADGDPIRGVPMLRMGNIQDGKLDLSDLKYMRTDADDVSRFLLHRGDIVFNRTNSPDLVGKAAVVDLDTPLVFASYLVRLSSNPQVALSPYVCYWINSPWGREWAQVVKTDGVSQSNINATKLAAMPLPLPPLAEQHEIVRRVDALFALADAVEQRVAAATGRAERLTQAVLAKAFRGELVPTEAELAQREGHPYEPAEVLLRRIVERRSQAGNAPTAVGKRQRRHESPTPGIPRLV